MMGKFILPCIHAKFQDEKIDSIRGDNRELTSDRASLMIGRFIRNTGRGLNAWQ
jgi:hypothetical protein